MITIELVDEKSKSKLTLEQESSPLDLIVCLEQEGADDCIIAIFPPSELPKLRAFVNALNIPEPPNNPAEGTSP